MAYDVLLAKKEGALVDHDPAGLPVHLGLALLFSLRGGRFRGERIQSQG